MKAKTRKTGEIVDIKSYNENNSKYYIHGVNSRGVEFGGEGDNFNEDFEFIEEKLKHWQDVAERAAIAALQGLLANPHSYKGNDTMKEGLVSMAAWKGYTLVKHLQELQDEDDEDEEEDDEDDYLKCTYQKNLP